MLQVILLELLVPQGQVLVVQKVVRHVVADVAEDATAVHGCGRVPAVEEDEMGQLPERRRENDKQGRRHD